MKIINNKLFKITAAISISALLLLSCGNKTNVEKTSSDENKTVREEKRPHWEPTAEKICVVFGYGYNSEEFIKAEVAHLEEYYGLSDGTENSGLIIPYVYPDDFKVGNTGRISQLVKYLDDVKVCGVITVGAPEYTSNTLSQLRDKMLIEEPGTEKKDDTEESHGVKPYPIYTLFPQDDILAIEATSDFVMDRAVDQSDKVEEMEKEEDDNSNAQQVNTIDIQPILDNAIDYMLLTKKPLKSDAKLLSHVTNIAGEEYKIKRYIDPETGLSSINHFIIEDASFSAN